MPHHCIKPVCGPRRCDCNGAISEEQRHVLMHSLMGGQRRYVYRNYFATTLDSDDATAIERCVQQGLMVKYRTDGDMGYFMCTEAGAAAVKCKLPSAA